MKKLIDKLKAKHCSDEILSDLNEARENLRKTICKVEILSHMMEEDGSCEVFTSYLDGEDWHYYDEFNCHAILCSLSDKKRDITVINVKFDKGGYIPPLKHDRIKTIYIIHGKLMDEYNDTLLKEGDTYRIEPDRIHSLKSDDCLCTISWKPAYEAKEKPF